MKAALFYVNEQKLIHWQSEHSKAFDGRFLIRSKREFCHALELRKDYYLKWDTRNTNRGSESIYLYGKYSPMLQVEMYHQVSCESSLAKGNISLNLAMFNFVS